MELRKNPSKNYEDKILLFRAIGLCVSIVLVMAAFEWKVSKTEEITPHDPQPKLPPEILEVLATRHADPQPPKPKIEEAEIKPIENKVEEEVIKEEKKILELVKKAEDIPLEKQIASTMDVILPDEPVDKPIFGSEIMPKPVDGLAVFYDYLRKNIKVPKRAKVAGVNGKVIIQFTVMEDGSLADFVIIQGLGYGCDEEAIRVLSMAAPWSPGKQGGRPVKVYQSIPIQFHTY